MKVRMKKVELNMIFEIMYCKCQGFLARIIVEFSMINLTFS